MAARTQASPQEIKALKASLKKLKPNRSLHFLYFDRGEDDVPVLVIDKVRVAGDRLKVLLASAKKKKPIKGMVSLNTDVNRVEFHPVKAPGKLQRSLKVFYKQVPQLKGARVIITQDKASVEMQMDEAEEVASEKVQAAEELKRRRKQLAAQVAKLEESEKEAEQERLALEAEGSSMWNLMANRSRAQKLELLQKKEEQRKWETDQAREKLAALTKSLTEAEVERQKAEDESADLKEMWSLIQQQEWEKRRRGDRDWRVKIEANMDRLSAKSEIADRLEEAAAKLEGALQIRTGEEHTLLTEIQVLEEQRRRALDRGEELSEETAEELKALKDRLREVADGLDAVKKETREARDAADRADAERDAARVARDKVFMTRDEGERSEDLRRELSDSEDSASRMHLALQGAVEVEQEAYKSLNAVNDTAAEVERLRLALASANFDLKDLTDRAGKWSLGKQSRREDIATAKEALPEASARALALQTQLDAAVATLTELETEAAGSLEQARGATAARLQLESRAAEADRDLARVNQEISEEEATVGEWALDLRRKNLNRLIKQDPTLKEARSVRNTRLESAEKLTDTLLDRTADLNALRHRNEALQREMAGFSQVLDPALTEEFAANLEKIGKLSDAVGDLRKKAELSARRAEEGEAALQLAIKTRCEEKPDLAQAHRALEQAEKALASSAQDDLDAIKAMEKADDTVAEVARQEKVYGLVLDGQATVRSHSAVFEKLRGMDLFSSTDMSAVRAAVGPAIDKIEAELEKQAYQMIQAGATNEELARVFERIPNGLRPASYREEVGAVNTLMQRFDEIEALKTQEDRDEYLIKTARQTSKEEMFDQVKTLLKELDTRREDFGYAGTQIAAEGGRVKTWMTMLGVLDSASTSQKELSSILAALWQVNRGIAAVGAGIKAGKALTAENEEADPVLQKIQDLEKLEALNGLANSGIDIARQFVPILLTGKLGKGFIEDVVQCASRTFKASYDSKLKAIAKVHGSFLAGPLEESLGNELKLAERYGFNAGVKAVAIAAQIMKMGPQAAMGFVVSVSAWSTGKVHGMIHNVVDWKQASKANKLLERAKAGDAKAKSLLLKHHAKFAKGVLALKAQEGDPFAMQYVASRGLSDDDIRKSSLDIITRYLLKSANQSGAEQTFDEWLVSKKTQFGRLADLVVVPLTFGWRSMFGRLQSVETIGDIEVPLISVPLDEARELVAVVEDTVALQERLSTRNEVTEAAQKDLEQTLKKLAELLVEQRSRGVKIRDRAGTQIVRIAKVEELFQQHLESPLALSSEQKTAMLGLQKAIPRIRMEHVELAGILTALA
ncbi:MAG: hypothetical protein ACI8RZ_002695 [Myxococcota bacterium]|jgi:hypothetical protein